VLYSSSKKPLTCGHCVKHNNPMVLESNRRVLSSKAAAHHNLARISARNAKLFLVELVNLRDGNEAAERFEGRFAQFRRSSGIQTFTTDIGCIDEAQFPGWQTVDLKHHDLFAMRDHLRLIWETRDLKTKEWRIFLFRVDPSMGVDLLMNPPPPNPFQQAVMYLLKWASKARTCHNRSCSSRYFFQVRKSQKYCSEDCAHLAECASKRRWWRKKGTSWREKRKLRRSI